MDALFGLVAIAFVGQIGLLGVMIFGLRSMRRLARENSGAAVAKPIRLRQPLWQDIHLTGGILVIVVTFLRFGLTSGSGWVLAIMASFGATMLLFRGVMIALAHKPLVLHEQGIVVRGGLIPWPELRGFRWHTDKKQHVSLLLRHRQCLQCLPIERPQDQPEVDRVFREHGVPFTG